MTGFDQVVVDQLLTGRRRRGDAHRVDVRAAVAQALEAGWTPTRIAERLRFNWRDLQEAIGEVEEERRAREEKRARIAAWLAAQDTDRVAS